MKTETEIPEDVARNIQASVNRKKDELEKEARTAEEKTKRDKEYTAIVEERWQTLRKKMMESAKKNLVSLNEFIRKEPLKSYLDSEKTTGFPLWEGSSTYPHAKLFLRNDGVYIWVGYPKTYESIKKITLNSLATHAQDCSNLPSYIWSLSLEKWNASNFVEYLRKQFTPIY